MQVFPVYLFLLGVGEGRGESRGAPAENVENEECKRRHLRPFCNAIKVLKLPECSLFVDVSEKKVTIYFIYLLYAFNCLSTEERSVYVRVY